MCSLSLLRESNLIREGAVVKEAIEAFRLQLVVPAQREVFDCWLECRQDGLLPKRQSFNPCSIPALLPSISIIDVLPDDRFKVRLAGTRLRDVFDREITGLSVAELERLSNPGYWQRACSAVVSSRMPVHGAIRSPRVTKDHLVQFWMRMPFVNEDGRISQLLGFDVCIPSLDIDFDLADCDQGSPDLMAI